MKTMQSGIIALLLLCGFVSCQKDIASEELSQASSKVRLTTTIETQSLTGSSMESSCPECVSSFATSAETDGTNAVLNHENGSLPVLSTSETIKTVALTKQVYTVENVKVTVSHDLDNVYFTFERTDASGFGNIRFKSPALTVIDKSYKGNTEVPPGTKKIQIVSPRNSLASCSEVSFAFIVGGSGSPISSEVLTYTLRKLCPPVCTIKVGDYRTHSRGYWPNKNGQAFLVANSDLFPVEIGAGSKIKTFTDAASVGTYIAEIIDAKGTPGALPNAGTFGAQVLSLAINLEADNQLADYSAAEGKLANLVVAIDEADIVAHPGWATLKAWNGKTVADIFAIAQTVLGGTSTEFSPSEMNEIVTAINENFEDGTANRGLLSCGK